MKRRQHGFSSFEYIVIGLAIVSALLLPYVNGQSVVQVLTEAVKEMFASFSFGISLSRLPTIF